MRSHHSTPWGPKLQIWALPIVAALVMILTLVPAEYWRHPVDDAVYRDFDPNLIYVDRKGGAPLSGLVEVSPKDLTLTALPNSRPTVTLATTPLRRLEMEMDLRIIDTRRGTVPFRIGVWSPNTRTGQFLEFGPPPSNLITSQRIVDGVVAPSLLSGRIATTAVLGSYVQGLSYRTTISIDKLKGVIDFLVEGGETPPSGHRMLRVMGGGHPQHSSHVLSDQVQIKGGEFYSFGGFVKHLGGSGTYGFVVEWIRDGVRVGITEEWHDVAELRTWTAKKFGAIAPPNATSARLILGTAPSVEVLFTDLFFSSDSKPDDNLLRNGTFSDRDRGWGKDVANSAPLEIVETSHVRYGRSIHAADAPELFRELRLSITANGFAESNVSKARISNYRLVLPHQRWLVVKVEDARVRAILLVLIAFASLLTAGSLISFARNKVRGAQGLKRTLERLGEVVNPHFATISLGVIALGVYSFANAMLFNAGSLNYDLRAATVWLYVIPQYGLSALYHLPTVVGPADSWGGVPVQEATFPYEPVMAGIFFIVAWLHRLLLGLPEPFLQDVFMSAFTVKATSLLFTIADAGLIFLILRAFDVSRLKSLLGAGMFLFNPAVIFVGSAWGQTQSISLFFLLLSIWVAALNRAVGAWIALALAVLTRQQFLVPCLLLGLHFIRKFPLRKNIEGISWGVLVTFLLMAPLALSISPSLPVDLVRNAFDLHILGGDSATTTLVSWSALSIWPLVTQQFAGQTQLGRIFYSGKELLIGNLTYWDVGNLLFVTLLLISLLALIFMRKNDRSTSDHVPIIALGTLGLFLLKTGFAAFHLIPALALVIIGGPIFGRAGHYLAVLVLTATILVAVYGVAGVWMIPHPTWSVGLFAPDHPITLLFVSLFVSDWFITLASLANLAVLGWLLLIVAHREWNGAFVFKRR